MIKWIRTSSLSIKNSLSCADGGADAGEGGAARARDPRGGSGHHPPPPSARRRRYMKGELHEKLSGNEVYCKNYSILLVESMLCSELHCQKGFNPIIFLYETQPYGGHTRNPRSSRRFWTPSDTSARAPPQATPTLECANIRNHFKTNTQLFQIRNYSKP